MNTDANLKPSADILYINYNVRTRYMNLIHAADGSPFIRRLPVTDSMFKDPERILRVLEYMGSIEDQLRIISVPEEEFFYLEGQNDGLRYYYLVLSP